MAEEVKKYTDIHPPFHSIFERVLNGEKLEITFGTSSIFYKISAIHVNAVKPFVMLENGQIVYFTEITGSQFSK